MITVALLTIIPTLLRNKSNQLPMEILAVSLGALFYLFLSHFVLPPAPSELLLNDAMAEHDVHHEEVYNHLQAGTGAAGADEESNEHNLHRKQRSTVNSVLWQTQKSQPASGVPNYNATSLPGPGDKKTSAAGAQREVTTLNRADQALHEPNHHDDIVFQSDNVRLVAGTASSPGDTQSTGGGSTAKDDEVVNTKQEQQEAKLLNTEKIYTDEPPGGLRSEPNPNEPHDVLSSSATCASSNEKTATQALKLKANTGEKVNDDLFAPPSTRAATTSPSKDSKQPRSPAEVEELTQHFKSLSQERYWRLSLLMFFSLLVHNFPEGLTVALSNEMSKSVGSNVAAAIFIHNVPEGLAISVPCMAAFPERKWIGFALASLSGLAEPVGAVISILFLQEVHLPAELVIAFALGVMLMCSCVELMPEAVRQEKLFLSGVECEGDGTGGTLVSWSPGTLVSRYQGDHIDMTGGDYADGVGDGANPSPSVDEVEEDPAEDAETGRGRAAGGSLPPSPERVRRSGTTRPFFTVTALGFLTGVAVMALTKYMKPGI